MDQSPKSTRKILLIKARSLPEKILKMHKIVINRKDAADWPTLVSREKVPSPNGQMDDDDDDYRLIRV